MAGGDGSLGTVAAVAVERDLPLVAIPFGTRNHFARDLGLDVDDPLAVLDAFGGQERRVDIGRAGDRLFLNNVSLGLYAELVHRREKHRRRRDTLARLRALLLLARDRGRSDHFVVDGDRADAHVVLVANNAYELDAFDLGARERLDGGQLHLYIAHGWRPSDLGGALLRARHGRHRRPPRQGGRRRRAGHVRDAARVPARAAARYACSCRQAEST